MITQTINVHESKHGIYRLMRMVEGLPKNAVFMIKPNYYLYNGVMTTRRGRMRKRAMRLSLPF